MNLVCVICPNSCLLSVDRNGGDVRVANNGCDRGAKFAVKEATDPERTLTSTIKVTNGELPLVSVRSDAPVKKDELSALVKTLDIRVIEAPVASGQVLFSGLGKNQVNIIATREVLKVAGN
jgi:CxxC motif-containing protein